MGFYMEDPTSGRDDTWVLQGRSVYVDRFGAASAGRVRLQRRIGRRPGSLPCFFWKIFMKCCITPAETKGLDLHP